MAVVLFITLALIMSVATAGCTSDQEPEQEEQPQEDTNEEPQTQDNTNEETQSDEENKSDEDQEQDLSGTTTYCGTWEGSFTGQGDVSGEWQFTVDFDSGEVTGWFEGDGGGDITGSVEDGIIEASGSAALGTVTWSGSFNLDGSEISGEWEVEGDLGSGTWEGSEGELQETQDETDEEETEEGTEDGTAEASTWDPYNFDKEVHYKYSFSLEDDSGTLNWDVTSVSGDQVTIETEIILEGGTTYSNEFSGDKDSVRDKLMTSPSGSFIATSLYSPMVTKFAEGELTEGNIWEVTTPQQTVKVEITGKETYSGIEGYVGQVKVDGVVVFESTIAKDLGFPTHVAGYNKDGEKEFEFVLEEYSE